jgi:hypothetical protein
MFWISHQGEGIDDADNIEGAREVARSGQPGRYDVDEIRAEPFASGHASRSWGRMIRHSDARVEDEAWSWEDYMPTVGAGVEPTSASDLQRGCPACR